MSSKEAPSSDAGGGKGSSSSSNKPSLEWMYTPSALVNREDYLLGRTVDKSLKLLDEAEKGNTFNYLDEVEKDLTPLSIFASQGSGPIDLIKKIKDDPLYIIQKKEEESLKQLLKNPVRMKELEERVRQRQAFATKTSSKSKNKSSKKSRSRDKKKSSKRRRKSSDASSSSSDDSDSDDDADNDNGASAKTFKDIDKLLSMKLQALKNSGGSRSKKAKRGKRGSSSSGSGSDSDDKDTKRHPPQRRDRPVPEYSSSSSRSWPQNDRRHESHDGRGDGRGRNDNLYSSSSYDRHRSDGRSRPGPRSRSPLRRDDERDRDRGHRTGSGSRSGTSSSSKPSRAPRQEEPNRVSNSMKEEELEKKRLEMMDNAKWRDVQRTKSVNQYRSAEKREKEDLEQKHDPDFIRKQLIRAAETGSVEQRIKSNSYNIQKSKSAMNQNFARR